MVVDAASANASPFTMDQAGLACPYPFYDELRAANEPTFVAEVDAWVVTDDAQIRAILKDTARFSNRKTTGPAAHRRMGQVLRRMLADDRSDGTAEASVSEWLHRGAARVLIDADPPEHGRQRALVNRAFTPRAVAPLEPAVRRLAHELIDAFLPPAAWGGPDASDRPEGPEVSDGPGAEVELIHAYARRIPLLVIAEQLGVGDGDLDTFEAWSDAFTALIGGNPDDDEIVAAARSQAEFYEYFDACLDEAAARPRSDVLSTVANARLPDGTALSRGEQLGMCAQFVVAGNETTAKAISTAVLLLCRRPDLEAELRRDPARIPALVEEVLRSDSPVQGLFREAKVDIEVGGTRVAAGQALFLAYGAANRDPAVWPEPDEVDLDRPAPTVHLAFGQGEHYCLGAALARLEARVALEVLLERVERLELSERNDLRYEPSWLLHGLEQLWLRLP